MMTDKHPYTKEYQNAETLVRLLQERGLAIDNPGKAARYLNTIYYYRLSAYLHPLLAFPKAANRYKSGASFRQALMLYRFDKKLRLLIFNEIEKIEVAVRTAIIDESAVELHSPFWMTEEQHFKDKGRFGKALKLIEHELGRTHEEFIVHFRDTYSDAYPPAWMLSEILPLGVITNLFTNLRSPRIKKRVAQRFGLQVPVFNSWMTVVTLTRNYCCHHARVWNKQNTIMPMAPMRTVRPWLTLETNPLRAYYDLCIIKYLLDAISPGNDMKAKIESLLRAYPQADTAAMGFPDGWEREPLWQ